MTDEKNEVAEAVESNPLYDVISNQIDTFLKNNNRRKTITCSFTDDEFAMMVKGAKMARYHRAKFCRAAALLGCSAYLTSQQAKKVKK